MTVLGRGSLCSITKHLNTNHINSWNRIGGSELRQELWQNVTVVGRITRKCILAVKHNVLPMRAEVVAAVVEAGELSVSPLFRVLTARIALETISSDYSEVSSQLQCTL